jgi:hypothetical protein
MSDDSARAGDDGQAAVARAVTDLSARLSGDGADFDEFEGPIYWPTREAERAEWDWPALAQWVNRLRARFPNMTARIPDCWYRHNDLVEALLALRDHERLSYASTAPASAAVEWHRAFRDMEGRWDTWIRRFTCVVPGRGHESLSLDSTTPDGFAEFVTDDLHHRIARERSQGEPAA